MPPNELELYYPLRRGLAFDYKYADPGITGQARLGRRCVEFSLQGSEVRARFEDVIVWSGEPRVREFDVIRTDESVTEGETVVLRVPLAVGTSWVSGPDDWEIDGIEDVAVPAGNFARCLRVTYSNEDVGGGSIWLSKQRGIVRAEQYGERGPFLMELAK